MGREERIRQEAAALWRELFAEPPPATDGGLMLDAIMRTLPDMDYDRLRSPHMRPGTVTLPR